MPATEELIENPSICMIPSAAVEFAAGDDGDEQKKIKLTLYDGSVVPHWFWGNLAFDLSTMKMAKGRNPILYNHDTDQRIAFSDKAEFEPKFVLQGRFLKTSTIAEQVKSDMDEGFPFEASLRFDPDCTDIEYIKEGNSTEVNGHKLKGPGTIMRNTTMLEGSVVVFGALKNTKSQRFAENPVFKETVMAKENETVLKAQYETAEAFAEAQPDMHGKIVETAKTEGIKSERTRFGELREACGTDYELLADCFAEGKSVNDALKTANAKLVAALAEREMAPSQAPTQAGEDPAIAEFKNAPDPDHQPAKKFDEFTATDEQLKERFAGDQELQDKFSSADSYIAYVRHAA